ncbi:polysaccharide pyruvyl transferase family protein [Alteromonas sp. A079]|uniref:polysaccharide pyruvyl transferase family protein n=1 Tax=Alteromonas sp. A079 TaxID=3410268 RepID=UPI003B9EA78B
MKYCLYEYSNSDNLGDEVQSIAAKRFLPTVDYFVDRDNWDSSNIKEPARLIANGWYTHNTETWLPSNEFISPLFISFHITPKARPVFEKKETLEFLQRHGPIGCRDFETKEFLLARGVDAYFSGCLTLTLQTRDIPSKHNATVFMDIPDRLVSKMPTKLLEQQLTVKQYYDKALLLLQKVDNKLGTSLARNIGFKRAQKLLDTYKGASLVITQRLHCALPCTAIGTPVVFLVPHYNDARYKGLISLTNHMSYEEFLENPSSILELDNRDAGKAKLLGEKLSAICSKFIADGTKPECIDLMVESGAIKSE